MVDFSSKVAEAAKIADRADAKFVQQAGGRLSFIMDLLAADGVNGNRPLDMEALLAADDFSFAHDVCGISRHIDRDTGELGDCFLPRFAR